MKPRHRVSRTAIELLKRFEGYRWQAAELPDGRWTIGYGHTQTARQGAQVSEEDAEALLLYDLIAVAHTVNELTYTPLSQNQFDALCGFTFNIGLDNFRRSSVLKRINEGALIQAACGMELWRKADFEGEWIVIDALVRRRAAEKALFLTPPGGAWVPVPSPVLKPAFDADAREMLPRQAPTPLVTSLEGEKVLVLREGEPAPAPAQPEEDASPARAAAEAVTARLQTLFPDPGETLEIEHPAEPRPQADFAPPITPRVESPPAADQPFVLTHPEEHLGERPFAPREPAFEPDETPGPGLFDAPAPANDTRTATPPDPLGEDPAPFQFPAARPEPAPTRRRTSLLSLVTLAVIGLAFFAGGLFWALNARTGFESGFINPLLVGGLAGLAGVGFFASAVYMLLERLSQAAERD
ncbi:glycoside hydrolase family protein [Phenylobacterium sp.]|uniref:glycoside hydrolase family protein n=1 Tax=Phenylobacterium sp. TaxID=1871053 RepID=UPI00398341B9